MTLNSDDRERLFSQLFLRILKGIFIIFFRANQRIMSGAKHFHKVWCDGCFDMTHFGHYNFMRQAAALGDELYVGVHNDEEVTRNKAPPVFTLQERMELVSACKWVTKAVPDAPYTTEVDFIKKYGCEACIHGDDVCLNGDGEDCYAAIKKAGMFATVPRTKAISTTNIIGRMLRLPKEQLPHNFDFSQLKDIAGDATSLHSYLPTTHRISQFSTVKEPTREDKVVYVDGTFDLLHPGHVSFLRKAKELGTYLVVGVHDDIVKEEKRDTPVLSLQERVLNVLAMKYVDDVIIGAPYIITRKLIDQIEPAVVVQGSAASRCMEVDAFKVPKELGIFQQIESDYPELTSKTVISRVLSNYAEYAKRNAKKEAVSYEQENMA